MNREHVDNNFLVCPMCWFFSVTGLEHITALVVGALLVFWGIQSFRGRNSFSTASVPFIAPIYSLYRSLMHSKSETNWYLRAFLLGLLSAFLPCGWLYSFVVVASSSGSAINGAIFMAVFWIGTVPALFGVGLLTGWFSKYFGGTQPQVIGILLIVAGLLSIGLHLFLPEFTESHSCH